MLDKGPIPTPNIKALDRNCIGCMKKRRHREDKEYSALIASFPFQGNTENKNNNINNNNEVNVQKKDNNNNNNNNNRKWECLSCTFMNDPKREICEICDAKRPKSNEENYIKHSVRVGDTLMALSLKYGVSKSEIQRLNNLLTDDIFYKDYLLIYDLAFLA